MTKGYSLRMETSFARYMEYEARALRFRNIENKYIDSRIVRKGFMVQGLLEQYGAVSSLMDYALASADGQVGALPEPFVVPVTAIIAADQSLEADEWGFNFAIEQARKGRYSIERLGIGFASCAKNRGHSVGLIGTYVSSVEWNNIEANKGIVDPNYLTFPTYNFTDVYPVGDGG